MTNNFYLAQALDNKSPDHIHINSTVLPENATQRQEISSLISKVTMSGTSLYNDGGVKLTELKGNVVIEIDTCQRDNIGRLAPIIVYFSTPKNISDAFINSQCSDILNFTQKINRTVSDENVKKIRSGLSHLKKKLLRDNIVLTLALILLIFLIVIFFLNNHTNKPVN